MLRSQQVPAAEENIPFLVTFGNQSNVSWGDDDFSQTFFFLVPENCKSSIYIRVFDPDISGQHDEMKTAFNTTTRFSVYGGAGSFSNPDAKGIDPVGNYKSGTLLSTKVFKDEKYDNDWYTFGPFFPNQGELDKNFGGYIFKVIADGIGGDDGNLYKYFMSTFTDKNSAVEGGNAFTYEYTFRLHDSPKQVSHIYPYVDSKVTSVKQNNFDGDMDGSIRIVSKDKPGINVTLSGENEWANSEHKITPAEHNSSLDIQFVKSPKGIQRNNIVMSIRNQYGELLPFYSVPIGGIPKFKARPVVKKH